MFDGAERMFDIAAHIGGKTKFTMVCIFKENTKCSGCQLLKYVFITLCIAKIVLLLLRRAKNRFSVSSHFQNEHNTLSTRYYFHTCIFKQNILSSTSQTSIQCIQMSQK